MRATSEEVSVSVRLGATWFVDSVELSPKAGGLAYRAGGIPFFKPWEPVGPGGPPVGSPLNYRVLYDGCRRGCEETAWFQSQAGTVIRDAATYEEDWRATFACNMCLDTCPPPPPPAPPVDFRSEVVVAIGPPYGHGGLYVGARILSVSEAGKSVVVHYEELEVPDGVHPGPGPWPFCQWALFIAVPDRGGPVTLIRSRRQLTEWKPWK